MARTVGIGHQDFGDLIREECFYVDKTDFIREWWENRDKVTLITRPRRFGKTLTMSMIEYFFSNQCKDQRDLFRNLSIWKEKNYHGLQGAYPVVALSFAGVKETSFLSARKKICQIITNLFNKFDFLLGSGCLNEKERENYQEVAFDMEDYMASDSLRTLSDYLMRYYGKKVIILLDEYDTPMQEAYMHGYWEEMADFVRSLFNAAFKANPYLERGIMTGITRIGKESVFSDLNNLTVVTTTSDMYADTFGFTEEEVRTALEEYGMCGRMPEVRSWYDGFTFGRKRDIYNPWSILNFLKTGELSTYWANTSSNSLISKLIQEGSPDIKTVTEDLLQGKSFHAVFDEQIIFSQLWQNEGAVWSLLLAGGYLRVEHSELNLSNGKREYDLKLTNLEARFSFMQMIGDWFQKDPHIYNGFIKALLQGDVQAMNIYMNKTAMATFSSFDVGKKPSEETEPERFYHGFVLGLMVDLASRYTITSNRESGYGRYDVMLEPLNDADDAIILEFKVHSPEDGRTLQESVDAALRQIEEKQYAYALKAKGIPEERIKCYGLAFEGKKVLIGAGNQGHAHRQFNR